MKQIRCTNPECRNHKYAMHKDFCPECKALIALRYIKRTKKSNKKDWILIHKIEDPSHSELVDEAWQFFNNPKEINRLTFCSYVSIDYLNMMFGYKCGEFMNDYNLSLFKCTWKKQPVVWMHRFKEDIVYIFGDPKFKP